MDPKANLLEQLRLARRINTIVDACPDDGDYYDDQLKAFSETAPRLAELVLALDEWMRKGGFSPWVGGAR